MLRMVERVINTRMTRLAGEIPGDLLFSDVLSPYPCFFTAVLVNNLVFIELYNIHEMHTYLTSRVSNMSHDAWC